MSTREWIPDIAIDAALAARLIAAQFPALAADRIEELGHGWDNAAFLTGGNICFRFPRRRIAGALIEREIATLPAIAPHVPLAISAPRYCGTPSDAFPWAFAGYALIAGETACAKAYTDAERDAFAEPLGAFLRALHALDPQPFAERGLPPDELGRLAFERRMAVTRERVDTLRELDRAEGVAAAAAWLEAHPAEAAPAVQLRIVHGDLYARHVIVGADGVPAGIIDWGDVHVGDPALDLGIAHAVLPAASHAKFRAAYGEIDDRTWRAARWRATYHAILEMEYGARVDDGAMFEAGATALRLMQPDGGER